MTETMTRDPDLDQAIEQFRGAAIRLRTIEAMMLNAATDKYRNLAAMIAERGEIWGDLKAKADKLNLVPGDTRLGAQTLLLLVEETGRLRARNRRKPTPLMVKTALRAAGDIAERDRIERAADRVAAHFAEIQFERRARAADAGINYIEASEA